MLYVVTYATESGDKGLIGVFEENPTPGQLTALTRIHLPDEIVEEDGGELSYAYLSVDAVEGISVLPPEEPVVLTL